MIRVAGLFIYPIKGCGGYAQDTCSIVAGGLENDRRYMIVDENGRMVTRREDARLAWIELAPSKTGFAASLAKASLAKASVARSETSSLILPRKMEDAPEEFSDWVESSVWSDKPRAKLHPEGSRWLSRALGRDLRLVYLPDESLRPVNPARAQPGDLVSFADGYPLLLTSESSLDDLNSRLDVPISMERFRPNVVVRGSESFAEDTWAALTLGGVRCVLPKLCDRCVVTTIAEGSGEKGKEPLKTLATFRRWNGAVWFGANVIARGVGIVAVGDAVAVDEVRPHPKNS